MSKLILIAGVSRSGKSSLAKMLCTGLKKSITIDQDSFTLPKSELPKIKGRIDWERPNSIDWKWLLEKYNQSQYSYKHIIIEGIFALSNELITNAADYIISLEISKQTYLERRKKESRWGNEPDWFIEHVWESHLKYHNPREVAIDLIVNEFDESKYKSIEAQIKAL